MKKKSLKTAREADNQERFISEHGSLKAEGFERLLEKMASEKPKEENQT